MAVGEDGAVGGLDGGGGRCPRRGRRRGGRSRRGRREGQRQTHEPARKQRLSRHSSSLSRRPSRDRGGPAVRRSPLQAENRSFVSLRERRLWQLGSPCQGVVKVASGTDAGTSSTGK